MMTTAKLDQIDGALRSRHPEVPGDLINRRATLAYLSASSPYAYRFLAARRDDLPRHQAFLERCPVRQIADSIDIDAYLTLELLDELVAMRRDRSQLEALRASVDELVSWVRRSSERPAIGPGAPIRPPTPRPRRSAAA